MLLRIKQIEFALRGGRLEDAYQRLKKTSVREHRRGQELLQELAQAFVKRGQSHLEKQQLDAAAIDCQRAADLVGQQEAVLELRQQIDAANRLDAANRRQRDGLADQVRSMIRRGDFEGGEQKLNEFSAAGGVRAGLAHEIQRKQSRLSSAIERARNAVADNDDEQALAALLEVQRLHPSHAEFLKLRTQYIDLALGQLQQSVVDGRLDHATRLVHRMQSLAANQDGVSDAEFLVDRLNQAAAAVRTGDLAEATRLLKQASRLAPRKTDWLKSAIANASIAAAEIDALQTGPLGLMGITRELQTTSPIVMPSSNSQPMNESYVDRPTAVVPERFLIQADGLGSFLVVRKDQTRLGPASSSRAPDVELQGMNKKANVRIDRLDEDYFLRSDRELSVNNQPKCEALLADGDIISLGKRCRGTFRLPSSTTSTAMLEFNGTSFPRRDIRGVLLLNDAILVGPGRNAHIRVGQQDKPAVLYLRGETLCCRSRNETVPVTFGEPFVVGDTSLVCTEV